MTVSVILTSHMKPYLADALASINRQTRRDFEVILLDSGQWRGKDDETSLAMARIHDGWHKHRLVQWVYTGEPPDLRTHACPVSKVTNDAIRAGLVTGEYVAHFYDDDEWEPTFIERMAGFLDEHPEHPAVWCTQDRVLITPRGERQVAGQIVADRVLEPGAIDCRVDGGQVMYRRAGLDLLGDPWMPEDPGGCYHSDGVFLERLVRAIGGVPPLNEMLTSHRSTPVSTYSPTA